MPVKKVGDKWWVKDTEYDTEEKANKAYMDYLALAMGVATNPGAKPKKKPATDKTDDSLD